MADRTATRSGRRYSTSSPTPRAPVNRNAVRLSSKNFWGEVFWSAADRRDRVAFYALFREAVDVVEEYGGLGNVSP